MVAGGDDFEVKARLKWFSSAAMLPSEDLQRRLHGTPSYDHNADVRITARASSGNSPAKSGGIQVGFIMDYSLSWGSGDSFAFVGGLQIPLDDNLRLLDLTWTIDEGPRHHAYHRLDRFALDIRSGGLGITVGRQAVSWGSGRVFQPIDLFNPFAPTAIDQDFKPGDDIVLIDKSFPTSNIQMLYVGRRDAEGNVHRDVASYAAKWHGFLGSNEMEVLAARHYVDAVYGFIFRVPVGGALMRTDVTATRLEDGEWYTSGIFNIDYSLSVAERPMLIFAEYFHNDFGVQELPSTPAMLPQSLLDRLSRSEIFNVMRDYFAVGASYQWHPLWSQNMTAITNLNDNSKLLITSLNYSPTDFTSLQIGLTTVFGKPGEEFGGIPVPSSVVTHSRPSVTTGGGTRAFIRFVYFR
jgi:hypothetical protein